MTTNLVAQIITLLAGVFGLAMLVLTIRKMRQETRLSKLAPLVAMGTTLLTTAVYLVITGAPVNGLLAVLLLILGLAIGLGEGRMTQLYYRGPTLMGKRSVGYLILWGLSYLLTILLAQSGSAALHAGGILTMMLGLGAAIGSNLLLLVRQFTLRPQVAPPSYPGAYPPVPPAIPTSLPR